MVYRLQLPPDPIETVFPGCTDKKYRGPAAYDYRHIKWIPDRVVATLVYGKGSRIQICHRPEGYSVWFRLSRLAESRLAEKDWKGEYDPYPEESYKRMEYWPAEVMEVLRARLTGEVWGTEYGNPGCKPLYPETLGTRDWRQEMNTPVMRIKLFRDYPFEWYKGSKIKDIIKTQHTI